MGRSVGDCGGGVADDSTGKGDESGVICAGVGVLFAVAWLMGSGVAVCAGNGEGDGFTRLQPRSKERIITH